MKLRGLERTGHSSNNEIDAGNGNSSARAYVNASDSGRPGRGRRLINLLGA